MKYEASVVIPVYNAETTIRKCVESLVCGQEKAIKVILVDDCSTDNSWEKCLELQLEYDNVLCIQNEKNSGVSFTRNHGLKHTEGKYVLFVDSDDWVSELYVKSLLNIAERYEDCLTLCGFHFVNRLASVENDYVFDITHGAVSFVYKQDFFCLNEKVMLQLVWNKAFRKDVIDNHNLQFDEMQSMGEDFLFVLDYMKAGAIQKCVVINEPLYYYVRANTNSLMSKFGLHELDKELVRYDKLYEICGKEDSIVRDAYFRAIKELKYNFVYQIMHTKLDKAQKLQHIESVMKNENVKAHYKAQKSILYKEKTYEVYKKVKRLYPRIKAKMLAFKTEYAIKTNRKKLKTKSISLISQNCIGGVFCHDMELAFQSPTINLFFEASDFVKYVSKFKYYNDLELKMQWKETYPIGCLGDICIHFMHYDTCKEAKDSWYKRLERIDYNNIVVLCTDRDGFDDNCFRIWNELPYKKVLFTAKEKYSGIDGSIYYEKYREQLAVPDLIPKREFYKDDVLIDVCNS